MDIDPRKSFNNLGSRGEIDEGSYRGQWNGGVKDGPLMGVVTRLVTLTRDDLIKCYTYLTRIGSQTRNIILVHKGNRLDHRLLLWRRFLARGRIARIIVIPPEIYTLAYTVPISSCLVLPPCPTVLRFVSFPYNFPEKRNFRIFFSNARRDTESFLLNFPSELQFCFISSFSMLPKVDHLRRNCDFERKASMVEPLYFYRCWSLLLLFELKRMSFVDVPTYCVLQSDSPEIHSSDVQRNTLGVEASKFQWTFLKTIRNSKC